MNRRRRTGRTKPTIVRFKVRPPYHVFPNDIDLNMSQNSTIQEVKRQIQLRIHVLVEKQKLYFRGRELRNEWLLRDSYNSPFSCKTANLFIIQLGIKAEVTPVPAEGKSSANLPEPQKILVKADCRYYRVGDLVDVFGADAGAWTEGTIRNILLQDADKRNTHSNLVFRVDMRWGDPPCTREVKFDEIRPRSFYTYKLSELSPRMTVLATYNFEKPEDFGYWYDFRIKTIGSKYIKGTILQGTKSIPNIKIKFFDHMMRIEKPTVGMHGNESPEVPLRRIPFYCDACQDKGSTCEECGCQKCKKKNNENQMLHCDECEDAFHIYCLNPPLRRIPVGFWYCSDCKNPEMPISEEEDESAESPHSSH